MKNAGEIFTFLVCAACAVLAGGVLAAVEPERFPPGLIERVSSDGERADRSLAALRALLERPLAVEYAGHLVMVPVTARAADVVEDPDASEITQLAVLRPVRGALPAISTTALAVDGVHILGEWRDHGLVDMGDHAGLEAAGHQARAVARLATERIAAGDGALMVAVGVQRAWTIDVALIGGERWPFDNAGMPVADFRHAGWRVLVDLEAPGARPVVRAWGDAASRELIVHLDLVDRIATDLNAVAEAMAAYRRDHDQRWPSVIVDGSPPPVWDRRAARLTTAASLEMLAGTSDDLDPAAFSDPRMADESLSEPRGDPGAIARAPDRRWAAWLCYDWSAPADAHSRRPVLSHREPVIHPRTRAAQFVVAFANGQTRVVAADLVTDDGIRSVSYRLINPHRVDDDLFSPDADGGDLFRPGRGDRERAFLR